VPLWRMDSSDEEAWSAYLDLARRHAEQLLHADDPYDVAVRFMSDTVDVLTIGEFAGRMYVLWGDLTDWVELKLAEQDRANAKMVRAAREWLVLNPRDSNAVDRYFDYWLHDVFVHERP
jgi:hypothetical protein